MSSDFLNSPPSPKASRVILVTGASRGIGAQTARALLSDGHHVIATARHIDDLDDLGEHERLLKVRLDVCDQDSVDAAADQVEAHWGAVEVLINNAGIAGSAPLHHTSDELWRQMIEVNLTGSFRVTRRFLGPMKKSSYGRVIFISSIAGISGCLYTSAYCAAKHGVIGMMRALALEVASTQVTANAICPGFVETDMARNAMTQIEATTGRSPDESRKALEGFSPQNRLIQPEEIVHTLRFLIGEGSRGVNGQALAIDGGQVMH